MNSYECPYHPGKFVVGNTLARNGKRARNERIGDGENSLVSSVDNQNE